MALDIDWECYFTPKFTHSATVAKNWFRPWYLANGYLTTGSNNTIPETYQYVPGQNWDDRSKDLITVAEITNTLRFGSTAKLIIETASEKDIFQLVDNVEDMYIKTITGASKANPCVITRVAHGFDTNDRVRIIDVQGMTELNDKTYILTKINNDSFSLNSTDSTSYGTYTSGGFATLYGVGHMLPRFEYPYRVHRINLRSKDDAAMPTDMFVGHLVGVQVTAASDVANDFKDGVWRIELDFVSFEHPRGLLGRNRGAALWHHRENATTDNYHLAFKSTDNLTFDSAITQVVAWMNTSRPTTDFPVTFSYIPNGSLPYTKSLGAQPISISGTVTMTNGSTAVTATSGAFLTQLQAGQKIKMSAHAESAWAFISSITDDNTLTLTSNYSGATLASTAHKINVTDVVTVDGRSTWEVLEKLLSYMGAVEGAGNRYIPQCSNTGAISVTHGGYVKTFEDSNPEDFRDREDMSNDTSTVLTADFNMIRVFFTQDNSSEYWIDMTVYKSDGAGGWDIVKTWPTEFVPFDPDNTHDKRNYGFPLQKAGTYKWVATTYSGVSAFGVSNLDGYAYTPQPYQFLNSPLQTDFSKVNSFVVTRGGCFDGFGGFSTNVTAGGSPEGCKDGGLTANGGYEKCTDAGAWGGCYPDPITAISEPVDPIFGVQGKYVRVKTLSEKNANDTVCRLNSKKTFECSHDSDSSIRNPMEGQILFIDGDTTDRRGDYVEMYSPEINEVIVLRVLKQIHKMSNQRLTTRTEAYRR